MIIYSRTHHAELHQHVYVFDYLPVCVFQAEDRFCNRSQTAGRQSGAAHPGLHDAHKYLHTGERNFNVIPPRPVLSTFRITGLAVSQDSCFWLCGVTLSSALDHRNYLSVT